MNFTQLLDHAFLACPMCMSGASGQTLIAANSAIGLMLAFLCSVLASFLCFIFYLARRARRFASEVPGEGSGQ